MPSPEQAASSSPWPQWDTPSHTRSDEMQMFESHCKGEFLVYNFCFCLDQVDWSPGSPCLGCSAALGSF